MLCSDLENFGKKNEGKKIEGEMKGKEKIKENKEWI